jgi:hypothetical protein
VEIQIGKIAYGAAEADARPMELEGSTDDPTDEELITTELVGLAKDSIARTIAHSMTMFTWNFERML